MKWYCLSCVDCEEHAEHGLSEEEAIENWKNKKYSKETLMMRKKLEPKEMDDDGALNLAIKVIEGLIKEYRCALQKVKDIENEGNRDKIKKAIDHAESCERKIRANAFVRIACVGPDDVIKTIKSEVAGEF